MRPGAQGSIWPETLFPDQGPQSLHEFVGEVHTSSAKFLDYWSRRRNHAVSTREQNDPNRPSNREPEVRRAATSLKIVKHDFDVRFSHGHRQDGRLTVTEIPRRDVRGNPGCGNNLEPGRFLDPLNRRVGRAVREDLVDHLIGDEQLIGFDL